MHRHLIAGALACFGSSLFGQAPDDAAVQAQGTINKIQNSAQNGLQRAQDAVDRNVPQISGSSNLGDGQNRSTLNGQNQVNGGIGSNGGAGVQGNIDMQNRVDRQSGQLNSNLSTQALGLSTLGGQQRNGILQDSTNQNGGAYQSNSDNEFQSPTIQRQGQAMQSGQSANQVLNAGSMQNNGEMQNMPMTPTWNSSQNNNMQQSWSSPAVGCVYVLRFDANGREFICMNGRPMYFDNVNSVSAQGNSGTQNQYRAGYGNYDLNNGQANSARTTNSSEVASPDRIRLGSDKQNDSKGRQNDLETQSEVDAKPDPVNPSKNSNDKTGPKS